MEKVQKFKSWSSNLLTSLAIIIGYEAKQIFDATSVSEKVVLVALSFIIGKYLSDLIINSLLSLKFFRRYLLGSIWIEGVWIQETYDDINGSSSLIGRGVAQFMYIGSELHLKTGVYHYKEPQLGKETWSQSNHAYVRESDLLYINHFTVGSGDTETTGIATGHFLLDSNSKYPTTYEGRMIYFDGKKAKRQITRRINPKLVKDAIKKGGDNWKNVLLQDNNQ